MRRDSTIRATSDSISRPKLYGHGTQHITYSSIRYLRSPPRRKPPFSVSILQQLLHQTLPYPSFRLPRLPSVVVLHHSRLHPQLRNSTIPSSIDFKPSIAPFRCQQIKRRMGSSASLNSDQPLPELAPARVSILSFRLLRTLDYESCSLRMPLPARP